MAVCSWEHQLHVPNGTKGWIDDKPTDIPYTSLIGSLNYCVITTRWDISYATNKCTQFTSKPSQIHWEVAKRILQYLLQTWDHSITFHQKRRGTDEHPHLLTSFTDADFSGDSNDRRSTSGWIFRFNNSPISWDLKKQGLITRSSMESKLVASSFTSVEGVWLIHLGKDFRHNFIPIPLFTDNQPFILYSQNDLSNTHTNTSTPNTITRAIKSQMEILSYTISPHTRTSLISSPSLYHCTNMFEGECCDK